MTGSHIEKAARMLSGSAGPSGVDSSQLQAILLNYGAHSEELREAVALSIRRQANTIIQWKDVRALKAKREIAFNKEPGVFPIKVRPVGIGESLDRCGER